MDLAVNTVSHAVTSALQMAPLVDNVLGLAAVIFDTGNIHKGHHCIKKAATTTTKRINISHGSSILYSGTVWIWRLFLEQAIPKQCEVLEANQVHLAKGGMSMVVESTWEQCFAGCPAVVQTGRIWNYYLQHYCHGLLIQKAPRYSSFQKQYKYFCKPESLLLSLCHPSSPLKWTLREWHNMAPPVLTPQGQQQTHNSQRLLVMRSKWNESQAQTKEATVSGIRATGVFWQWHTNTPNKYHQWKLTYFSRD